MEFEHIFQLLHRYSWHACGHSASGVPAIGWNSSFEAGRIFQAETEDTVLVVADCCTSVPSALQGHSKVAIVAQNTQVASDLCCVVLEDRCRVALCVDLLGKPSGVALAMRSLLDVYRDWGLQCMDVDCYNVTGMPPSSHRTLS